MEIPCSSLRMILTQTPRHPQSYRNDRRELFLLREIQSLPKSASSWCLRKIYNNYGEIVRKRKALTELKPNPLNRSKVLTLGVRHSVLRVLSVLLKLFWTEARMVKDNKGWFKMVPGIVGTKWEPHAWLFAMQTFFFQVSFQGLHSPLHGPFVSVSCVTVSLRLGPMRASTAGS